MPPRHLFQQIKYLFECLIESAEQSEQVKTILPDIVLWIYTAIAKAITIDGIIDEKEREFIEDVLQPYSMIHMDAFRKFSRDLHSPDIFLKELPGCDYLNKDLRELILEVISEILAVDGILEDEELEYVTELVALMGLPGSYVAWVNEKLQDKINR
ncbi:MAG: hypothetical protein HQM11_03570 [SAR324 cluster bacterium]|nr:hypothetical protein [SAR324 cluster bacterium]